MTLKIPVRILSLSVRKNKKQPASTFAGCQKLHLKLQYYVLYIMVKVNEPVTSMLPALSELTLMLLLLSGSFA